MTNNSTNNNNSNAPKSKSGNHNEKEPLVTYETSGEGKKYQKHSVEISEISLSLRLCWKYFNFYTVPNFCTYQIEELTNTF